MDAADGVDGQGNHMVDIPLHDPFKAVAQPDDVDLFESGADGRRADDAVNAGGRPAADEDREIVMVRHKWMIPESDTVSGAARQKSRCARVAPLYNPLSGGVRRIRRSLVLRAWSLSVRTRRQHQGRPGTKDGPKAEGPSTKDDRSRRWRISCAGSVRGS